MCTVTWTRNGADYHLFMNRDELHTRGHALPPAQAEQSGVAYLAPTDSDGGGTWIGANELGVTVALLNNYPNYAPPQRDFTSRGYLVRLLMELTGAEAMPSVVRSLDLTNYRPFTVLVVDPSQSVLADWHGSGEILVNSAPTNPIASSSFDSQAVIDTRRHTYVDAITTDNPPPDSLLRYHASHTPEKGPYSVCVHREDGGSKSLSHVSVTATDVRFSYVDGAPCEGGPQTTQSLPRRR